MTVKFGDLLAPNVGCRYVWIWRTREVQFLE